MGKDPFPSDLDLVDYCLGALESEQGQAVEQAAAGDPNVRERLNRIRSHLDVLDAWSATSPPADLADHTLDRVPVERLPAHRAPAEAPAGGRRYRRIDILVAACVLVMATLLLIPAVEQARHAQRVQCCAQHLSVMGQALLQYADQHGGHFPFVGTDGPSHRAGMFGALLLEAQYLDEPAVLTCPGVVCSAPRRRTPLMPDIRQAIGDPARLRSLLRQASGDYGYALGFFVGRTYVSPRRDLGGTGIIVADSPYRRCATADCSQAARHRDANSANHGGQGQNVLFADGHVRWITIRRIGADDIFLNGQGQVRAGTTLADNVVGFGTDQP